MLNNFNSIPFKTATCLLKNKQKKYKKSCIKTKIQIRNKTKETKIKIKTFFFVQTLFLRNLIVVNSQESTMTF